MARPRISAAIITMDEERNILRALDSLNWVDEIVVVDSGSSDRTVDICKAAGAKVHVVEWKGYVATKNLANEFVTGEWTLSLDADEQVTPELRAEIEKILEDPDAKDGYRIPRKNHYWGRWIKHCGWYPDYQTRLWKTGKGKWVGGRVHEHCDVNGTLGKTRAALNHFTYGSIEEHLERMNDYSTFSSEDRLEKGRRIDLPELMVAAPWQFFRLYILRLGVLDGVPGLTVCTLGAFYAFLKKAKHWELQLRDKSLRKG